MFKRKQIDLLLNIIYKLFSYLYEYSKTNVFLNK